jgi:hypothetical protein
MVPICRPSMKLRIWPTTHWQDKEWNVALAVVDCGGSVVGEGAGVGVGVGAGAGVLTGAGLVGVSLPHPIPRSRRPNAAN